MRQSRTDRYRKLFGESGYASPWLSYATLYIFAVVLILYYLIKCPIGTLNDTFNYLEASNYIEKGVLHQARPPVYPLVLSVLRTIFGTDHLFFTTVLIQNLIYLVSIVVFGILAQQVIGSKKIAFWSTFAYIIFPTNAYYNFMILTESLSISLTVIFLWAMLRNTAWKSAFLSGLLLIVLIYLRPAMLCLLPVYIVYWAWVAIKQKRKSIPALATMTGMLIVCFTSLSIYQKEINRLYGINTMASTSIINNYFAVRELNLLRSEHTENPEFKLFLDSIQNSSVRDTVTGGIKWTEHFYMKDTANIPIKEREIAVNKAKSTDALFYLHAGMAHLPHLLNNPLYLVPDVFPWYYLPVMITFSLTTYIIFLLLATILMIWRVRSISPWILYLTSCAIVASSIVGAMGEWTRLISSSFSPTLLLFAYLFTPAIRAWKTKLQ